MTKKKQKLNNTINTNNDAHAVTHGKIVKSLIRLNSFLKKITHNVMPP